MGDLSSWKAYDLTGLVTGKVPQSQQEALFYSSVIWNRPWWGAYNTEQMQGLAKKTEVVPDDMEGQEVREEQLDPRLEWLYPIAERILNDPRDEVPAYEIRNTPEWQLPGIHASIIRRYLAGVFGITSKSDKQGRYIMSFSKPKSAQYGGLTAVGV